MRKKPNIKYTEMAIYVDKHIHEPDHDVEKIYEYLVMLAYMLSVKRRFFEHEWYYDRFSEYLARIVYMRIVKADRPQYAKRKVNNEVIKIELKEGDRGWLSPIKSCLNYMKQVLYAKKCQFIGEEFNYSPKTLDISEVLYKYSKNDVLKSNNDLLTSDIHTYLSTLDKIIWSEIQNCAYANDKVLSWHLYSSCLLSLVRNLTLSKKNMLKIKRMEDHVTLTEDVISDIMEEESKNAAIVIGSDIEQSYVNYVDYLIQRIKKRIILDIRELSTAYDITDEMVEDILLADSNLDGDED